MSPRCLLLFGLLLVPIKAQELLPSTPASLADVHAIQTRLKTHIPATTQATVCLEIMGGSGTGVIVSPNGLIYTAAHVASGVRREITVILADGTKLKGKTLGVDTVYDAAMIQILNLEKKLPFIPICHTAPQLGDWVFALGHSGGWDAVRGIPVRLGRIVGNLDETLQTDCKLIGGDSGGPLFNMKGELIGIHSRVGTQLENNMHVTISRFDQSKDDLLASKWIGRGEFAQWQPARLGVMFFPGNKAWVFMVEEHSPAKQAGMELGDIILEWNEQPISNKEDLLRAIHQSSAYENISIMVERNGSKKALNVTLETPDEPDELLDSPLPLWYFKE